MNNDNFVWTDELVAEYSLASQKLTIFEFKRSKIIPKKEYEIVSFKNTITGNIDNIDNKRALLNINWWLDDKNWVIYSVRRLSDGEVFTIGDKIKWDWVLASVSFFTIKEFMVEDGLLKFKIDIGDWYNLIDITKTHNLKKVEDKKPILTTEDGVEYFEGEKKSVYCIGKDNWCIDTHPEYYNQLDDYYSKFFSTKEKALDYCLMNKPNMSIKDVTDIILILSGLLYDKTIVDKIEYNGRLVSAIIDNQKSKLK